MRRTDRLSWAPKRKRHDSLDRAVVGVHSCRMRNAARWPVCSTCCGVRPTYERLVGAWNLDKSEAVEAVQWLIAKVIAAVQNNEAATLPQ